MKKSLGNLNKQNKIKVSVSNTWMCSDPGEVESEVESHGWRHFAVLAGNSGMMLRRPRIGRSPIMRSESAGRTDTLARLPYLFSQEVPGR